MGYYDNPNLTYNTDPFKNAYSMYDTAAKSAMPSDESLNRADARVRSRVTQDTNNNMSKISDAFAGNGRSDSGARAWSQALAQGQGSNALAQGLTDNINNWEKQRQEGSQILSSIGQSYGTTGKGEGDLLNTNKELDITQGLGEGKLANEKLSIDNTATKDLQDFLTQSLGIFGQYGNTMKDLNKNNPDFNAQFQWIIKSLLSSMGMANGGVS